MKTIFNRIYSDYLMPSRMAQHERLLLQARDAGFSQTSVREFHASLSVEKPVEKVIVHRHDIDTDLRTARKLFDIESKHGIRASYYFRLSTLDLGLMHEIEAAGSEASYHYEELATFAKKNHISDPAEIRNKLPQIRAEFEANFQSIAQQFGKKLHTVASHGDFANRRLKVSNTEILDDHQLRMRCGIVCETYDKSLLGHFDLYITDRPSPVYYHPISPFDAIGSHRKICLLTHPRQFETNWRENTKDNLYRFYEGLAW
jgi:hypothetical protein